jgi:hypothetical protein
MGIAEELPYHDNLNLPYSGASVLKNEVEADVLILR